MNEIQRRCWTTMAIVGALIAVTAGAPQNTLSAEALYRRAEQMERVNGNIQGAIELYQQIVDAPDANTKLKSQAQKRLTELKATSVRSFSERVICSDGCAGYRAGASISADGRYLASVDENDALSIWDTMTGRVVRPAGVKPLTYGPWPLLSPDGQQVVYNVVERDANNRIVKQSLELVRADANARPRTLVDSSEYHDFMPGGWSGSGQEVLVAAAKPDDTWVLAWVSVTNGKVRPVKSLGWRFTPVLHRPVLSPDGRYIAYAAMASNPPSARSGPGDTHIYVLPVDGKGPEIELVTGASANVNPAWMPDSRRVLFVSDRSGEHELWSATLPTEDRQPASPVLVKRSTGNIRPVGMTKTAFYYTTTENRPPQFAVMDSRGNAPRGLKRETPLTIMGTSPAWSPDGTRLAFKRPALGVGTSPQRNLLFVYALGSNSERRYTIGSNGAANLGTPLWLHDGKTLIQPVSSQGETSLFRVDSSREDAKGTEIARVASTSNSLLLSSTDRAVYVLVNGSSPRTGGTRMDRIVEVELDGGRQREVATISASTEMLLSPDDKTLYLRSGCNPDCDRILAVDTASGQETQVLKLSSPEVFATAPNFNNPGPGIFSRSGGAGLALSPDGRMLAAIAMTLPTAEFQVLQIGLDGKGHRQLAEVKAGRLSWLKDGTIVATSDSGLVRIPPGGGTPEIIKTVKSHDVTFSHDGLHMAVATGGDRVPVVRSIDNVSALVKAAK